MIKPKAAALAYGFSLVELLIALALSLGLVIAAAALYLGNSSTLRALAEQQNVQENGQYALDMIGRDLRNAGFYPLIRTQSAQQLQADSYSNIVAGKPAAYNSGVYGCSAMRFKDDRCKPHPTAGITADSLVVNYFTNDAMGSKIGQRMDCAGGDVSLSVENLARIDQDKSAASYSGDKLGRVPKQPLWVSNRYTLNPMSFKHDGQSIQTASLACSGSRSSYQPAVSGIEALQFRFGVFTDPETQQAAGYYSASEMDGLASVVIDNQSRDAWSRVSSVEVCLLARGLSPSRLTPSNSSASAYRNCQGDSMQPNDKFIRRVHRKVFALRNHLTQTLIP